MSKAYRVTSGHYMCHPETCECDDWQMEGPDKSKCFSSDDKSLLQSRCDELNLELTQE